MTNNLNWNVHELDEWELTTSQEYFLNLGKISREQKPSLDEIILEGKKIIDNLDDKSLLEFIELLSRYKRPDIFSNIQPAINELENYLELKWKTPNVWKEPKNPVDKLTWETAKKTENIL